MFVVIRKWILELVLDFLRLIFFWRKKKILIDFCEEINVFNGCCKKCECIEKFLGVDMEDFFDGFVFLFGVFIVDIKYLFNKENG